MAVHVIIDKKPLVLKIPMKPFLIKFLHSKFGENHKASKATWLGTSAVKLLSFDYSRPKKVKNKHCMTLVIPPTWCLQYGYFVNYNAIPEFKTNIERIFRDFMHEYIKINAQDESYGEITRSLKKFLKYYEISEDEFKLDSAYRHYLRSTKEKVNKTQKNRVNKKAS